MDNIMDNTMERNEDAILAEQIRKELGMVEANAMEQSEEQVSDDSSTSVAEFEDDDVGFDAHENTYEEPEPEPDPLGNKYSIGIRHDWDDNLVGGDDDEDPWIDRKVTGQEAFEYQRILRQQKGSAGRLIGYDTDSIMKAAVRIWIDKNRKLLNLPLLLDNCGVKRKCVIEGKTYYYPTPVMEAIRTEILSTYDELRIEANEALKKSDSTKLKKFDDLPGWAIADILVATGGVRVLNTKHGKNIQGTDHLIFKDYFKNDWTGGKMKWSGQWRQYQEKSRTDLVNKFFRKLCPSATSADKEDFVTHLYAEAPVSLISSRNDLIFWRNGVWDYTLQKFTNYDDPDYDELYGDVICMAKYAVNHPLGRMWGGQPEMPKDANGNPIEPKILEPDGKTVWSPSYQLKAPFNIGTPQGDACHDCIMRFFQFTLRGMNGSPHYYLIWIDGLGGGTNAKGTTGDMLAYLMIAEGITKYCDDLHCENLIIDLCIEDLATDHSLNSNLLYARWIRGQESTGAVKMVSAEACREMKLLSRVQPVSFRDLYQMPMSLAFEGGLSQEINSFPILAEKTGAMMKHTLTIPFDVSFGLAKQYIKDEYLKRLDVRSWLAWYITTQLPCYDAYSDQSVRILQGKSDEVLRENMNTAQFFDEVLPMIPMDVIPPDLIFPLYQNWCKVHGYTGTQCVNRKSFIKDMQQYAKMKGSVVDFSVAQKRMKKEDLLYQQMNNDPDPHYHIEALRRYGYDKQGNALEFVRKSYYGYDTNAYCERSDMLDWTFFGSVVYMQTISPSHPNMLIQEVKGLKQYRNCFVRKTSVYVDPSQCSTTYALDDDDEDDE